MTDKERRICFVVQRYGREVAGGAETLCREVATRLSRRYKITVLTTCALDYLTWENHYAAGEGIVDGVRILRFPVSRTRRVRSFGRFSVKLYNQPHSVSDEMKWMELQGPESPGLQKFIGGAYEDFDLFVFFTYLYATTFFGLPKVAGKSVLVPMAHPEDPLKLEIFSYLFHMPRAFIFNTPEERDLVHSVFNCGYIPDTVAGMGIELPIKAKARDSQAEGEEAETHYVLYVGRLDVQKGLNELMDFFRRYRTADPKAGLRLLLVGEKKMRLPKHPDIVFLGYVTEEKKRELLEGALAAMIPSPHESLSITALEAWAHARPVIATGRSEVLAGQCRRSGGGLIYNRYEEFADALDRIRNIPSLGADLGRKGRDFVSREYSWETIERKYNGFIDSTLQSFPPVDHHAAS